MSLCGKSVLVLLGGQWHDFEGFGAYAASLLESVGARAEATYDMETLSRLREGRYDIVLSYTCFTSDEEGEKGGPDRLTKAQSDALIAWVRSGGGFLAVHAATVIGRSDPALGELLGGVFVSHPPQFAFTLYPVFEEHPITAGIEAFTVHDEFYVETHAPDARIHLVALDRGLAYPMAWSRIEGKGRVAHIAPGHSREVWELPPYKRLLLQALDWLAGGD
jgi:type 1 glutamine amidotransferase